MRYFVCAAVGALAIGLVSPNPASAAAPFWECMGPPGACASAKPKAAKHAYQGTRKQKASATYKSKKKSYSSASSYSGGGGGSTGIASYYWQGQQTASGARFNPNGMTAAHRTLPFGTKVLVTHLGTGRTVTVTINDRGPFVKGRIIDLSRGAAASLGMTGAGVARVSVAVLGRS